ncbi:unnamed protein product, partial [Staurois parvus]
CRRVRITGRPLVSSLQQDLTCSSVCILLVIPCTVCSLWSSPVLSAVSGHPCTVSAVSGHPCSVSAVSGHPLHCPQSLVISCTMSAVSGHPLYCLQSLVISCTVCSLLVIPYNVHSLWSSPVLSAVSGHLQYCP